MVGGDVRGAAASGSSVAMAIGGVSKAASGGTTQYVLDLAATLPVVISDTEAVYLYGLDIIAQQQTGRYYYVHDGLGSVRQLVDTTGQIEANYAYDPFGVPVMGGEVYNPYQYTGEAWDGGWGCCTCGPGTTSRRWGGSLRRIRGWETRTGRALSIGTHMSQTTPSTTRTPVACRDPTLLGLVALKVPPDLASLRSIPATLWIIEI